MFTPAVVSTFPAGFRFYRVHREGQSAAFFDAGSDGRFNPPGSLASAFGVLYLSTSPEGAFIETLGRTRYLRQPDISERRMTTCSFGRPLRAFRVSSRANRFRYDGLDLARDAVASNHDYVMSQRLAGLVWADETESFDAIVYAARHDNSQQMTSVAVFGEPGSRGAAEVFADHKTEPISDDLVSSMVSQFRFEMLPDAPLL